MALHAIFSDVHGNLQAYEAFLEAGKKEGVDKYFCVGDIVGYGANPHECIEITRQLKCPVVCGNHDQAAAGTFGTDYFNEDAKKAVIWTKGALGDIDKDYLKSLKLMYQDDECTLVHGGLDHPEDFGYIRDAAEAAGSIDLQKTLLCFVGHSHRAAIFYKDAEGCVQFAEEPKVRLTPGRRYLVNVGSIGQPRDGDWRSSYCVYDTEDNILRIERIDYDVKKAQDEILKAGLPSSLAVRLAEGR